MQHSHCNTNIATLILQHIHSINSATFILPHSHCNKHKRFNMIVITTLLALQYYHCKPSHCNISHGDHSHCKQATHKRHHRRGGRRYTRAAGRNALSTIGQVSFFYVHLPQETLLRMGLWRETRGGGGREAREGAERESERRPLDVKLFPLYKARAGPPDRLYKALLPL